MQPRLRTTKLDSAGKINMIHSEAVCHGWAILFAITALDSLSQIQGTLERTVTSEDRNSNSDTNEGNMQIFV